MNERYNQEVDGVAFFNEMNKKGEDWLATLPPLDNRHGYLVSMVRYTKQDLENNGYAQIKQDIMNMFLEVSERSAVTAALAEGAEEWVKALDKSIDLVLDALSVPGNIIEMRYTLLMMTLEAFTNLEPFNHVPFNTGYGPLPLFNLDDDVTSLSIDLVYDTLRFLTEVNEMVGGVLILV